MKKRYLILLFFASCLLQAQSWRPVSGLSGGEISGFSLSSDGIVFCSSGNRIFSLDEVSTKWNEYRTNVFISQPITAYGFLSDELWLIGAGETIFRSSDKGINWELTDSLSLDNVRCFVHLGNDSILSGTDRNLLLSTDNGIVWNVISNWKLGAPKIFKTSSRIFVSTFYGLYESDFSLKQWTKTTFGKDGDQINGLLCQKGDSIFAYTPETNKIYYTTNGGNIWLVRGMMMPWTINGNPFVSEDGTHFVITKEKGLIKSTNIGLYWDRADTGFLTIPLRSRYLETKDKFFFSDGLRIYKANKNELQWTICIDGIKALNINAITFFNDEVYIGTNQNGFYVSSDRGITFKPSAFELDEADVTCLAKAMNNSFYVGTYMNGIMMKMSDNDSFVQRNDGIEHSTSPNIYSILIDSYGELHTTLIGTLGVYRRSTSWEKFDYDSLYYCDVYDIKHGPNHNDLYLATDNGIFYSSFEGDSWQHLSLRGKLITSLLIAEFEIYAGTWSADGVLASTDGGRNWSVRNNGLPKFCMIRNIIRGDDGFVYAATLNSGIFRTSDAGNNWEAINSGLPTGDMGQIALAQWGKLYAATRGWGLFEFDAASDVSIKTTDNIIISPNPASDYIEIDINDVILSEAKNRNGVETSVAHPSIFDVLGMEITTPNLTPTLSEGEGVVRINVSHLSPGVYFVRVGNMVRKFVKI
jgi:photosystem II stability/assembly factor-like uncharacterized protein